MLDLFNGLNFNISFMLLVALIFVLFYEVINGFHDAANAVASVIYTRALNAKIAVIMSGLFNFIGVLTSGLSVAYTIVHLLPTNILLNTDSYHTLIIMFSILSTSILWNLSTWYLGLPSSSSHTLIGSIIGINIINILINKNSILNIINTPKLLNILSSLIISPIIGFILSGIIILILRKYKKNYQQIHLTPLEQKKLTGNYKPPLLIRIALIISACGVSFFHGANDGQKGIGLIMLILIGVAPTNFVVNMKSNNYDIIKTYDAVNSLQKYYDHHHNIFSNILNKKINNKNKVINYNYKLYNNLFAVKKSLKLLKNLNNYNKLNTNERFLIRHLFIYITNTIDSISLLPNISIKNKIFLNNVHNDLLYTIEYAPIWIIVDIALAISLGTIIGWRKIVKTIGEKISIKNITYAQGLSSQITTTISIGIASYTGIPISTTHVLSSAITGAIIADGGNIQKKTIKNILIAWILTIPATIILSIIVYWILI